MPKSILGWFGLCALCAVVWLGLPATGWAADSLNWRTNAALVSADIKAGKLPWLLERVTSATGWQVYVEPGVSHIVSTKFENLPPGQALHLLLGDLSFALVPESSGSPKLFVFRTTIGKATQRVVLSRSPRFRSR